MSELPDRFTAERAAEAAAEGRRVWVAPALLLAPPWIAVGLWIALVAAAGLLPTRPAMAAFQLVAFAHLLFAVAASAAGGWPRSAARPLSALPSASPRPCTAGRRSSG